MRPLPALHARTVPWLRPDAVVPCAVCPPYDRVASGPGHSWTHPERGGLAEGARAKEREWAAPTLVQRLLAAATSSEVAVMRRIPFQRER